MKKTIQDNTENQNPSELPAAPLNRRIVKDQNRSSRISLFSDLQKEQLKTKESHQPLEATSPISPREAACLSWAAIGKTAPEIAEVLSISEHTVHFHTKNAIKKLNTSNKTHAVAKAIVNGYIILNL